ncbi:MAG: hypothetical protein MR387_12450 [Phocaeicola plebeius]|nr:hypothetical protein [Phocaeicola plebeius]
MNSICNEDCFHCPYPDCIRDDLTAATYAELATIDKTIINPPTWKQRKVAAQKRAYREANREKVAAQKRAWYEANKDKWREYNRRSRAKKKALAAAATTDKGK